MGIEELQNETLKVATEHIKNQKNRVAIQKLWIICLCVLLCAAIVCGTVISCTAIKEQNAVIVKQLYSLNMQYTSLADLLYGASINIDSQEIVDSGDGGNAIKIDGNNNTVGGD